MLSFVEKVGGRKSLYKCACGNTTIAFDSNVSRGHTKSCGCLRKQVTSVRSKTHGHKSNNSRSKVYIAWVSMKSRCNNENLKDSKNYKGRGINYCSRWEVFENFLEDMGEPGKDMSLDRIDNMLGYSKENCRWASRKEQGNNKRNNVRYLFQGVSKTLVEWSKDLGIGRVTLLKRLQRGVPTEIAFSTKGYLKYER